MSKEDFLNQLSYGVCTGSVELVSPNCIEGSPGLKPEPCPYKEAQYKGRKEIVPCNCCELCRDNCTWMSKILISNQRESQKSMRELTQKLHSLEKLAKAQDE